MYSNYLVALFITALVLLLINKLFRSFNIVDKPDGSRKIHKGNISLAQTIIKASLDPNIDTKVLNALILSRNDFDKKTLADSLHQEILKVYEN